MYIWHFQAKHNLQNKTEKKLSYEDEGDKKNVKNQQNARISQVCVFFKNKKLINLMLEFIF